MLGGDGAPSTTTVAVISAADGVRCVASGEWNEDVLPALVCYVKQRADDVLWPESASRVRASIAEGRSHAAVVEYFETVGARWDDECLAIYVVRRDDADPVATAAVGDVRPRRSRAPAARA